MANKMTSAAWMGVGLMTSTLGAGVWLQAQAAPAQFAPPPRAAAPRVYAGADVGWRVEAMRGDTPIVVPVVKIDGEWVDVELGGGGIRKLTK